MKTIGIDWGEKRIGLALAKNSLAQPYGVVLSVGELFGLLKKEEIQRVVLGLPEGKFEERVRNLGREIEKELLIPVVLRSEVLTTHQALEKAIEAGKSRKSRRNLDALSAALLLQEYLDTTPSA